MLATVFAQAPGIGLSYAVLSNQKQTDETSAGFPIAHKKILSQSG